MDVRSPGNRPGLIFQRFEGEPLDRGDYLVLLTLSNPAYCWGNMLVFADPAHKMEQYKRMVAGVWEADSALSWMAYS